MTFSDYKRVVTEHLHNDAGMTSAEITRVLRPPGALRFAHAADLPADELAADVAHAFYARYVRAARAGLVDTVTLTGKKV